jgi:uncharacterized membrane protein YhiD involved in acid resistance
MLGAMTPPTELELIARLALAVALGAVLGLERETRHKTAGLRTHTLVALGAALFTIAGAFAVVGVQNDPSRVAAQVVTGIGFIGAGAMIRSGVTITGITTAATLWVAAAFGVAAALGLYLVSVAAGAMALIVVLAFGPLKPYVLFARSRRRLDISHVAGHDILDALISQVGDSGGRLSVIETSDEDNMRRTSVVVWGITAPQFEQPASSPRRPCRRHRDQPATPDRLTQMADQFATPEPKPFVEGSGPRNVVVILLDSLNRRMLGCYGGTEFETPNLDRLAARSLRFDRHYSASLPCMPARHDILCGAWDFLWRPWGSIEVWESNIAREMKMSGVATGIITDHPHLFETGGENYHTDFGMWDYVRGHEDDPWRLREDPSWSDTCTTSHRGWSTGATTPLVHGSGRGRLSRTADHAGNRRLAGPQRRTPRPVLPVGGRVRSPRTLRHPRRWAYRHQTSVTSRLRSASLRTQGDREGGHHNTSGRTTQGQLRTNCR